jgi:hypothetical protein
LEVHFFVVAVVDGAIRGDLFGLFSLITLLAAALRLILINGGDVLKEI